jgi:NAD(P)-dependent dehydrogenase (short-subunit alcohol dehydrogenase family)
MKLKDRVAVVTGGAKGIGRSICIAFAMEGADIVIADILRNEARSVVEEIEGLGRRAISCEVDVRKPEQVLRAVDQTVEAFGRIDILVNNAGIMGKRNFLWLGDDENWRNVVEVQLFGNYNCTKAFLPKIIEQQSGRIINISSVQGKQASPTNSAYTAAKHGIIGITRTVAAELALLGLTGITVNAICPGVVDTDLVMGSDGAVEQIAELLNTTTEAVIEERIKPLSLQRRILDVDEIAAMALYLASDDARGITGQAINVCGGTVFY